MRKQTKLWITKEGNKIRICDLADDHLNNAMKMIERMAKEVTNEKLNQLMSCPIPNGEMASYAFEQELDNLSMHGISPEEIKPIYENLKEEKERRDSLKEVDILK